MVVVEKQPIERLMIVGMGEIILEYTLEDTIKSENEIIVRQERFSVGDHFGGDSLFVSMHKSEYSAFSAT